MSTALEEPARLNVIDTSGMTKEQRFKLRKIGASDSPIICGVGYKGETRLSLCMKKQGLVEESRDEDYAERFWWGDELEPLIAKRFTLKTGMKFAAHQVLVVHPEYDWMSATIDGVTTDGDIVDFKASSYWGGKGVEDGDPDTLPEGWIIQANHQMACCERKRAFWAQFLGADLKLQTFEIERDDAIIELIIQLGTEFIGHVRNGTTPEEFESRDAEFLRKHFNKVDGETVSFHDRPELATMARNFDNTKAAIKEMEEERDRTKAALLMAMGNAERAFLPHGWSMTRKQKGRKEFVSKATNWVELQVKNGDRS
jgi:putative phage-type endonuclease